MSSIVTTANTLKRGSRGAPIKGQPKERSSHRRTITLMTAGSRSSQEQHLTLQMHESLQYLNR